MDKQIRENKEQVVNSDKKISREGIGRNNKKAQEGRYKSK